MRYDLNPAQKGHLFDQFAKLVHVTGRGDRSYERVRRGLQDLIDGRFVPDNDETHQLFVSPDQQIKNVRHWNSIEQWGFTEEDFERLPAPPVWPQEHLCAVVLVPYFNSRKETFENLRSLMHGGERGTLISRYGWGVHTMGRYQPDIPGIDNESKYVRHARGVFMGGGLRWRVASLGSNRGASLRWIDETDQQLAAAEVLAAAAHFPNWLMAMDGREVPYVWLAGYRLVVEAFEIGHFYRGNTTVSPLLYFDPLTRYPRFRIADPEFGNDMVAIPAVKS